MQQHYFDDPDLSWGVGWALGQALTPTQDAQISGYLSQLFLITAAGPIPTQGVAAYGAVTKAACDAANQITAGSGQCAQNALSVLQQVKQQFPAAKVFANGQTATSNSVDLIVDLTGMNGAAIAPPGSPYALVTISPGGPTVKQQLAMRPSGTVAGLVVGALVGGGLGSLAGPIGAVGGAIAGGYIGNAITKA